METRLDPDKLAAWRSFITAHARLIDRIDRNLANANLISLHWYDVLIELAEAPGHRLRMHELATSVVLSRSGLTRLVDRLEKEGYLIRERDATDRRGAYAVITEQGLQALRKAWPVYAQGIASYFATYLSDEDAQNLKVIFGRIIATD